MRPASPPHSQPHRFAPNPLPITTIHSPVRSYAEPVRSPQPSLEPAPPSIELPARPTVVPKYIESGYIVGPPIAYTNQPALPANYTPFSPTHTPPGQFTPTGSQIGLSQTQFAAQSSAISIPPRPPVSLTASQLGESTPSIVVHAPTRDSRPRDA